MEIEDTFKKALEESQIVLLLISADYLASYYCYDVEMETAMKMREENGAQVIPVLLRPVDLTGTSFDGLKSLPEDRKAVSVFQNEDEAYENVAKGIRRIAETWYKRSRDGLGQNKGAGRSSEPNIVKQRGSQINQGFQFYGGTFNDDIVNNNR